MALNFKRWLLEKLSGENERVTAEQIFASDVYAAGVDVYVRELSFWACVNLIAGAIAKCEFKTFHQGVEKKGEEYYLWNLSPNKNQSSSVFLNKLIAALFRHNEALVIEQGGELLVADSFYRKPFALYDDQFTQVTVGDFCFLRSFSQYEVLYFKLRERDLKPLLDGLYESYRGLLECGIKGYRKSRGTKGSLAIDALATGDREFIESYEDIKNGSFRKFAEAENAVLPLWKGMNYTEHGGKTYSSEGTRDIRAMIDDISDFTAKTMNIPPALMRGDVQGITDALGQFLTFCIDPLADMLEEEINRKRNGRAVLSGTRLKIDTKCIVHVDLLAVSTAIDKLVSSGAFCVNDIRALLGEPVIDEPWANQHFMTKNYASVQDLLAALQNEA